MIDKIKLVDELLENNPEATVGDFLREVKDLETELSIIEETANKQYGKQNIHFNDKAFLNKK